MVKVTKTTAGSGKAATTVYVVEDGLYRGVVCPSVRRGGPWKYAIRRAEPADSPFVERGQADTMLEAVALTAAAVARWGRAGWMYPVVEEALSKEAN